MIRTTTTVILQNMKINQIGIYYFPSNQSSKNNTWKAWCTVLYVHTSSSLLIDEEMNTLRIFSSQILILA